MVKKEVVKEVLESIRKKYGVLQPKTVVDEARPLDSPIHSYFDWDDSSAAEKFRQNQAMHLIVSVTVSYKGREVDYYYNVQTEVVPQKGYYALDEVVDNKDLYNEVIKTALSELEYWQSKYRDIKELKKVINQVELQQVQTGVRMG